MINLPEKCLRNETNCSPLSQVVSDCKTSFICCGHNDGTNRSFPDDRFRLCWVNQNIDDISDFDERDIKDTISVMAQALSADANMKNNEEKIS